MNVAAALVTMEQATTCIERVKAYRDSLRTVPRIARLQILDMDHLLKVTNIYVRLHLRQDTKVRYEIETTLLDVELTRDPNAFIQALRTAFPRGFLLLLKPPLAVMIAKTQYK